MRRVAAWLATCALIAHGVLAQEARTFAEPTPALAAVDWSRKPVYLLTMGQGDQVFEKFGHNAIAIWDDVLARPIVYNYGTFDFDQPNFLMRFLTGDTKYWVTVEPFEQTVAQYRALNRSMIAQEMAMSSAQRAELARLLAENALEANRYYRYDYYRDNCSTRVRDMLNRVTGGAIEQQMRAMPGDGSYRWHTRRALGYSAPLYFGAQLVLGVDADATLNRWDEAFLPRILSESIRRVSLPAADGLPRRSAVVREDTLLLARRDPEPLTVRSRLPLAVGAGAVLAALLWLGGTWSGRRGAAVLVAGWALLCTVLGVILLLAWFATRHIYMRDNPSVALMHPAWLIGIPLAVATWRARLSRRATQVGTTLLLIGALGVVGAALAGHASALELGALLLPPHAAIAALLQRARGTA